MQKAADVTPQQMAARLRARLAERLPGLELDVSIESFESHWSALISSPAFSGTWGHGFQPDDPLAVEDLTAKLGFFFETWLDQQVRH